MFCSLILATGVAQYLPKQHLKFDGTVRVCLLRKYLKRSRVVLHRKFVLLRSGIVTPQNRSGACVEDIHALVLSFFKSEHRMVSGPIEFAHLQECGCEAYARIAQLEVALGLK